MMPRDDTTVGRLFARPDSRAVSFTVSYVLTVAIAVVLISGVVVAAGQLVRDERTEAIQGEATIVGDQTAAAVMQADRLARRGTGATLALGLTLPDKLAGRPYTVALRDAGGDISIVVRTSSPSVSVSTLLTSDTGVTEASVDGGDLRVVLRPDDTLTIKGGGS